MCRFTLYMGPPVRLETLLLEPSHSLIRQSTHALEREEPLNGDGFGVGWYQPDQSPEPAVYRSVTPAWNNRNLRNLARVIASPCILAHVRAATHSSGVNEANCHPFRFGRVLCMHNGEVGRFPAIRRQLLASVCDAAFANVYGSTDTEHFFAVVIDELLRRAGDDGDLLLAEALNAAIWRVQALVDQLGDGVTNRLNVALSDGDHAVVSRFSSRAGERPESLYFIMDPLYEPAATGPARRQHERSDAVVVASERLTDQGGWKEIPPNHIVAFGRDTPPRLFACRPDGLSATGP